MPDVRLTPNFRLSEFACKDGTSVPDMLRPNVVELARALQKLRTFVGRPVVVISGYRTPGHNAAVDGVSDSEHLRAAAADVQIEGYRSEEIAEVLEGLIRLRAIPDGGIGIYSSPSAHYDLGPGGRRWDWR